MNKIFGIAHLQIYVVAILLTLNFCHGHYLHMSATEKRVCGAEIPELLGVLCHGKFNPILTKKSVNEDYLNENSASDFGGVGENRIDESAFIAKLASGGIFPRIRRSWMSGITKDCCTNPCSVATLRQYCY